eukprot:4891733-Alexandrium_andersonii.AAC.1
MYLHRALCCAAAVLRQLDELGRHIRAQGTAGEAPAERPVVRQVRPHIRRSRVCARARPCAFS